MSFDEWKKARLRLDGCRAGLRKDGMMTTTARTFTEYQLGKIHASRLSSCRIVLRENGTGEWWVNINGVSALSDHVALPRRMASEAIDEIIEELNEAKKIMRVEAKR